MIGSLRVRTAAALIAASAMPTAGQSVEPGAYLGYNELAYVNAAGRSANVSMARRA